MTVDVLDDHDGVVDDQADGHGEPPHRHDVDRLAEPSHDQECRHHGQRQRHRGDERQPPVAQEDEQDDDGEDAADDDRVADVDDRGGDELGEIVGLRQFQPGGERLRQIVQHGFDAGADVEDVGADLLRDVEVGCDLAVAADERNAIGRAALDRRHVRDADRRRALDHERRRRNVLDALPHPRRQHEMLQTAGVVAADGVEPVCRFERVGDVADGQPRRGQPRRIGDDFDLARVGRQHLDVADAGHARQRRAHDVEGVVVEVGGRQAAAQVDAEKRERRRRQPLDREIEILRERAARFRDPSLRLLQRQDHVGGRVELRRDLRRAAERRRAHAPDARHFEQRLLDRAGHGQHHRLRGNGAAVADDDDAREDQRRIDVARELERRVEPGGGQHDGHGDDGAAVAIDERGQAHLAGAISAPSGNPCCPCTMTFSPAFTPEVSSASFGVVSPSVTLRRCALLSAPATMTKASSSS
jgi:hypothetical protein